MAIFQEAFEYAHKIFPNGGTCLEFGVYTGETYLYQAKRIFTKYKQSNLIGFDSWQGLPEETTGIWRPERHARTKFSSPKSIVLSKLRHHRHDSRFRLVDGFFNQTLTKELQKEISNLIFVNIDVDIHKSTLEVLDFVYPLLQKGTVLYFDDWKDPQDNNSEPWGEHLAWEQWSSRHPETQVKTIKINDLNQRFMEVICTR